MEDNADRARDLLAARREHSKGEGNLPTPEPHFGLRDERPEDREASDLPKDRDDRSAPKGDVPAGQEDRNPALETRVQRTPAPRANPPGGMELVQREVRGPARSRGEQEPGQAAKDTEKNAKRRASEARAAKRPARMPSRAGRASGLTAAPRRTAKAAPSERPGGRSATGRSGNVQRTAARARGSAKPLTKRAAKGGAGPNKTQPTSHGGKKASSRTSAGKGRSGRR